jgi:hypothetical protein
MFPTANAPDKIFSANIYAHPEWPTFSKMMKEVGIGPLKINQAWGLLMKGFETEQRLRSAGQGNKDNNPEYQALAKLLGDELKIDAGTSLALWSGGFAVSEYARAKGHTTLEFTKAGRAINRIQFHKEWKLQAPLWNTLSRAFVHQGSPDIHIYIRAWQPTSVLIRQEVPHLREVQSIFGTATLHWHALYTGTLVPSAGLGWLAVEANKTPAAKELTKEITFDGRLVDDYEFRQRDLCVAALSKFLTYLNTDPQNRAAKEMAALLEDNQRVRKAGTQ